MIDISNYPNNRDEFVGAEALMKFLHGRTSGVFALDGTAMVSAKQGAMAVNISDGYGWIADAEENGTVWWIDTKKRTGSEASLTIDAADAVNPRIDRVLIEWDTTLYTQHPHLTVLKGKPASVPRAPALKNNTLTRQISLAQVLVKPGALKITPGDVTDERADPAVCGIVTYRENLDTASFYAQFNDLLQDLRRNISGVLDGSAYLTKTGGKMSGTIDMASNQISNVGGATHTGDALSLGFADSRYTRMATLWENPQPGQAFAPAIASCKASEYDMILVIAEIYVGSLEYHFNGITSAFLLTKSNVPGQIIGNDYMGACIREFSLTSGGVQFAPGYYAGNGVNVADEDNSYCVPLKIIGIKAGSAAASTETFATPNFRR